MMKMKKMISLLFLFATFSVCPIFPIPSGWQTDTFFQVLTFSFRLPYPSGSTPTFPSTSKKILEWGVFQPQKSSSESSSRVTPAEHSTPGPICQEKAAAKLKNFLIKKKKKIYIPFYYIIFFPSCQAF